MRMANLFGRLVRSSTVPRWMWSGQAMAASGPSRRRSTAVSDLLQGVLRPALRRFQGADFHKPVNWPNLRPVKRVW